MSESKIALIGGLLAALFLSACGSGEAEGIKADDLKDNAEVTFIAGSSFNSGNGMTYLGITPVYGTTFSYSQSFDPPRASVRLTVPFGAYRVHFGSSSHTDTQWPHPGCRDSWFQFSRQDSRYITIRP